MSRDPGLQPERTSLAWRRTALAVGVNGLLVTRAALTQRSAWLTVVAALLVLGAGGFLLVGERRHYLLLSCRPGPAAPHASLMVLALAAVLLVCAAAVTITWP